MKTVMTSVPKMAGIRPPSVLASRGSSKMNSPSREAKSFTRPQVSRRFGNQARMTCVSGTTTSRPAASWEISEATAPPATTFLASSCKAAKRPSRTAISFCKAVISSASFRSSARRSETLALSIAALTSPMRCRVISMSFSRTAAAAATSVWKAASNAGSVTGMTLPSDLRSDCGRTKAGPFSTRSRPRTSAGKVSPLILASSTQR